MLVQSMLGGLCLLVVFGGGPSCTKAGDSDWESKLALIHTTPVTIVV
jgi:hypothetical protein